MSLRSHKESYKHVQPLKYRKGILKKYFQRYTEASRFNISSLHCLFIQFHNFEIHELHKVQIPKFLL